MVACQGITGAKPELWSHTGADGHPRCLQADSPPNRKARGRWHTERAADELQRSGKE